MLKRAEVVLMIIAVTVGAPLRHAAPVGRMRGRQFLFRDDVDTQSFRRRVLEHEIARGDVSLTIQQPVILAAVRIVATGAAQRAGRISSAGRGRVNRIAERAPGFGDDAVPCMTARDRIPRAVRAIVQVACGKEYKIARALFRWRIQRIQSPYRAEIGHVAGQTGIGGGGELKQPRPGFDRRNAVFAVVHRVAGIATGHTGFMKGKSLNTEAKKPKS